MKVYSKFKEGCTAEFYGEPDSKGVQAALITDPDLNDGVPFNSLTVPLEWSPVPLTPLPEHAPHEAYVAILHKNGEVWYELASTLRQIRLECLGSSYADLLGYFKIVPPKMVSAPESLTDSDD